MPLFSVLSVASLRNMGIPLASGRATGQERGIVVHMWLFRIRVYVLALYEGLTVPSECRREGAE